jgi:hypothetical protein
LLDDRATIKTARGILILFAALSSFADQAFDGMTSLLFFTRFFPRRSDLLPIAPWMQSVKGNL